MGDELSPAGGPAGPEGRDGGPRPAPTKWVVRSWQRCVALGKDLLAAAGGLLAVVTLCLVGAIVVESLFERTITVQPLSVPRSLSDDGLSTQVVALQLRDEMNGLTEEVRHQRGWSLSTQVMDPEEMPDVVVPTVGLSAQALAGNVRAFFKIQNRLVISGEVVSLDDLYRITLRLNGRPIFRSAKGQPRDHLDDLFKEAARAALQNTQPDVGAAVAFDDGDLRTALRLCDAAIGGGGTEAKYGHILKARTLAALGRRDEAIAEFKAAVALAPQFALPHTGLAEVYRVLGRNDDAVKEYEAGIALGPTLFAPHMLMADGMRALGHADRALDEYRAAASFSPSRPGPHYRLGNDMRDLGKAEEAVAQYEDAIAIDWTFVRAHYALGDLLRDLGRREEAVERYKAAVALDPRSAEGHERLGAVLDELGRGDEAQSQQKVAASLKPRP